jgi:hypothetical protein
LKTAYVNVDRLYDINAYDRSHAQFKGAKETMILSLLSNFSTSFTGEYFERLEDVEIDTNELQTLAASLQVSNLPAISGNSSISHETRATEKKIRYISFTKMIDTITSFINDIDIDRIFILIDEWSEIPMNCQYILAELIKRTFITLKATFKIAAIPNRTKLAVDRVGLEDGGDIFGYLLDNRFIYELEPDITKTFFNELLFNQLSLINSELYNQFYKSGKTQPTHNFLNIFLANQALREILIASAGIPRDFLSLFIGSYSHYMERRTDNRRITLTDVRQATISWYSIDKKKAVDSNGNARVLLDKIIQEVLINKKRCHFLIPEKYENIKELNDLIDLRVIHLRKKGISHKGRKGISYNVYYLDYACYTSSNIYHNRIKSNLLNEIETTDDFREIRRVSLEDKFFDDYNTEIGNSFKCPHCGGMVNTGHPAFIKQRICNQCYEKIE